MGKTAFKQDLFSNQRQGDLPMESLAKTLRNLHQKSKSYQPMVARNISDNEIIEQAECCVQKFELAPDKSLTEMVQSEGGIVHIVGFDDFCILHDDDINILENSIYVHDIHQDAGANKFDIILSANCDSYEHRFILAHEIGHFILHRDKGRCYANRLKNSKNKTVEDEADLFAGSLLLPEKTFKDAYKSLDGNYGDLSLYFRVPWDIIARRVKRLRLGIK